MDTKKIYKGEWCISSSTPCRKERLRAHTEFEASDFKKMLDEGWEIRATKLKRPRIQREKTPLKVEVSVMNGLVKVIVDFTEWQEHGSVGTIVKKIY